MHTKTKFILSITVICFLAALCVLGFMLYEVHSKGRDLDTRIALIAERNAKVQMYTKLSRLVEDTQLERSKLQKYVLTEDETSSFLTDIEALGAVVGVELATRELAVEKKDGAFDELAIEFEVTGTEGAVKQMLSVFETLPYHSAVSSVVLSKESNGNFTGVIELDVSLSSYDQ